MRVLILSCNTGEGHNSTARAIAEVLKARGDDSYIMDALSLWSPKASKFICSWHVRLYRGAPKLFNAGYRFSEKQPAEPEGEGMIYDLLARGAEPMYRMIQENQFDAVICVHIFAAMMLTEVRRQFGLGIPSSLVATDYTCSPCAERCVVDQFFIPDERLIPEFVQRGIPEEKLTATGIPVRQSFFLPKDPKKARRTLGLPEEKKILLCMSGSMGAGPIKKIVRETVARLPEDAFAVCVCGNNAKLYDSLSELGTGERMKVIGYTKQVPLYMEAADLMLTKPGGLSSTEAAAERLPMVLADFVGGCEGRNLEFFCGNGFALSAQDPDTLPELVCRALSDGNLRAGLSEKLERCFQHNGGVEICDQVALAVKNKKESEN